MPVFAHHANGTDKTRTRCPGLCPLGHATVVGSAGKAGASRSFFVNAPAGARIAWLRYRAGVRGGFPDASDKPAQIGARMRQTPQKAAVGQACQRIRRPRRPASGRVCWLPCFRRHGHEAGGLQKSRLCAPSQPGPALSTRFVAHDRLTRQQTTSTRLPPPRGQAEEGAGAQIEWNNDASR
jgi:hypothetical protein